MHYSVSSRLDESQSMRILGNLIEAPFRLGHSLLHKIMFYLKSRTSKTLMFPKQAVLSDRKVCTHWSARKSEEFAFGNILASFQEASHGVKDH